MVRETVNNDFQMELDKWLARFKRDLEKKLKEAKKEFERIQTRGRSCKNGEISEI